MLQIEIAQIIEQIKEEIEIDASVKAISIKNNIKRINLYFLDLTNSRLVC